MICPKCQHWIYCPTCGSRMERLDLVRAIEHDHSHLVSQEEERQAITDLIQAKEEKP